MPSANAFLRRFAPATADAAAQVCVVGHLASNHGGSLDQAMDLLISAAAAGADAVQLPLVDPEHLYSRQSFAEFSDAEAKQRRRELRRHALPVGDFEEIREEAHVNEMAFIAELACIEDIPAADDAEPDALAVSWFDAANVPLLQALAELELPLLVPIAGHRPDELRPAFDLLAQHEPGVVLLHASGHDPAEDATCHLGQIRRLAADHGHPVGLLDTTMETTTAAAAVAAGALVLVRRVTYNTQAEGPEHHLSLDTVHFTHYADLARQTAVMLGPTQRDQPDETQATTRQWDGQSLAAARDLPAGHVVRESDLCLRRPGTGLPPAKWPEVLGTTVSQPIAAGDLLPADILEA